MAFGMMCYLNHLLCLLYGFCSSVQVFAVQLSSDQASRLKPLLLAICCELRCPVTKELWQFPSLAQHSRDLHPTRVNTCPANKFEEPNTSISDTHIAHPTRLAPCVCAWRCAKLRSAPFCTSAHGCTVDALRYASHINGFAEIFQKNLTLRYFFEKLRKTVSRSLK